MDTLDEKFKKLHISSPLELALILPHRYEDYRLKTTLEINTPTLIDATLQTIRKTPSSIQMEFFAHNLGHTLKGVIFRPKPYMLHQFLQGERYYLYGQVDCKGGSCSLNMPKKVSEQHIGKVLPVYKTSLRNDVLRKLIKNYLHVKIFTQENIPEEIAKILLSIHFPISMPDEKTKQKQLYALKYLEIFLYMRELQKKKSSFPALSSHVNDISHWINSLPFQLTNEQLSAIKDIQNDLAKPVAAKRMVVGDVGCGKTMVILASVLLNLPNRSILMAPTTILAKQLYEEAKKFLHVKTTLVTNKTKKLPLDEYELIIGTHALLYRELPQATLVMVDEQHRFGTKQRALLSKLVENGNKKPHYLQFSATPIPRTQAMIDSSYIDVSLITTTPFEKKISTKVITKKDFPSLLKHIKQELAQNHQVLIIYPLVEESEAINYQSIDEARGYWEKNFTDVYVTHGKDKEKEKILEEFRTHGKILLATTVVEVGISLPRLTTVIIVGAERLGLATLHQLRGRVSRTGLQGYCYLYTNAKESKRLEEFSKTTNGFTIAELDLRYRQSGDLLRGDHQSGKAFKFFDMAEDANILQEVQKILN